MAARDSGKTLAAGLRAAQPCGSQARSCWVQGYTEATSLVVAAGVVTLTRLLQILCGDTATSSMPGGERPVHALKRLTQTVKQLAATAVARQQEPPGGGQAAPVAAAEDPEVAVRRARALALRSCANPRCSNLAGASEGALRGRKCGGCRVVRYCSDACCRADWPAHRQAGKLLQRDLGSAV